MHDAQVPWGSLMLGGLLLILDHLVPGFHQLTLKAAEFTATLYQ